MLLVCFCSVLWEGGVFLTALLAQGEQSLEYLCGEIVAVIEFFFIARDPEAFIWKLVTNGSGHSVLLGQRRQVMA